MESTEPNNTRLVRVLRHDFEPSERLESSAKNLLEPGTQNRHLRFHATKLAFLDGVNFNNSRYYETVHDVEDTFIHRNAPVLLTGAANTVRMSEDIVRINFQVLQQGAFNQLLAGFNELDTLRPEEPGVKHYVYIEVAANALLQSSQARRKAFTDFASRLAKPDQKRLHYLRPLEVTGTDRLIKDQDSYKEIAARVLKHEPWEEAS